MCIAWVAKNVSFSPSCVSAMKGKRYSDDDCGMQKNGLPRWAVGSRSWHTFLYASSHTLGPHSR